MLEFSILGPLSIRAPDGELTISGAKRRALLVRLLVDANQRIPVDLLIEDLWDGDAPAGAGSTIQSHISTLRKDIGADRLRFADGCYELAVGEEELDVQAAAQDSSGGRQAFQEGAFDDASVLLHRALGRWRGQPLEDVKGSAWALPEVSRLKELRSATLEALHDVLLAQGKPQDVVASAEPLVALDPLRERLSAQLMLALYRCGRQADALRVYGDLRCRLGEELGLEPTRQLVELESDIVLQKRELDWVPPDPAAMSPGSRGATGPSGVLALPDAVGMAPRIFVGRGPQKDLLHRALKLACTDTKPIAVLIGGEPGIGKSSLALTMAREAHQAGANVLFGHCDRDLGIPFQPWREALERLLTEPSPAVEEVVERHRPVLSALGVLEDAPAERAALDTETYVLFGAVIDLLGAAADQRGLVLVLDDLHGADVESLQMLRKLVSGSLRIPVLVIVTFRDSEVTPGSVLAALLADLRRMADVERAVLKGLDDEELLSFLELQAGHRLDDETLPLRDALLTETNGNPFFVGELLRHLVETGAVARNEAGHWAADPEAVHREMPASLSEVIGERVARLGPRATSTLSIAAVVGREFELDFLALVARTDRLALLEQLEAALAASLVIDLGAGRFSFSHALVDRALYSQMAPTRRALVHAEVAEALEQTRGDDPARSAEIALLWMKATLPREENKAISYAKAAADHALGRLAPDEAMRWYQEALDLLERRPSPDERLRCEILVGLGDALRQAGDPAHRVTLLGAAHQAIGLDDTPLLVRACLANTRGFFAEAGHIDVERVAFLEEAVRRTAGERGSQRARVLALLAAELAFNTHQDRRRALSDEALTQARESGDSSTLAVVLNFRIAAIQDPDTMGEVLVNTAEAIELAEELRNPLVGGFAAGWRYIVALQAADRSEADRMWEMMQEASLTLGQPTIAWLVSFMNASRATVSGNFEEAAQLAEEALKLGTETGQPDAFNIYGAQVLRLSRETDKADDILPIVEGVVAASPDDITARAMMARLYCDLGRLHDARACVADYATGERSVVRNLFWTCTLSLIADTLADLDWAESANGFLKLLDPYTAQWDWASPSSNGPIARPVGRLAALTGDQTHAEECFERALSISETMGSILHAAHTHLDWGRFLAEGPDRQEARTHLERAAELADHYELALISRLASTALGDLAMG